MRKFILLILLLQLIVVVVPKKANAQISSIGIATFIPINSNHVEDGDIIVASSNGYVLSSSSYDPKIIGVVSLNPAVSIQTPGQKHGFPVVSSGTAYVKVAGSNGNIKKGDYITSSDIAGTGMKAGESGFMLGNSLSDVTFKKGEIKLIAVSVNPHPAQLDTNPANSLTNIFKLSTVAAYEKPSRVLQYVIAAIITIVSFGAGFLIFAKVVNTGIEALGRNPLAGRQIQLSIIFNLLLIALIVAAGTALAYLVIRL